LVLFVTFVFINSPPAFVIRRAILAIRGSSLRPGTIRPGRMVGFCVSIFLVSLAPVKPVRVSSLPVLRREYPRSVAFHRPYFVSFVFFVVPFASDPLFAADCIDSMGAEKDCPPETLPRSCKSPKNSPFCRK